MCGQTREVVSVGYVALHGVEVDLAWHGQMVKLGRRRGCMANVVPL